MRSLAGSPLSGGNVSSGWGKGSRATAWMRGYCVRRHTARMNRCADNDPGNGKTWPCLAIRLLLLAAVKQCGHKYFNFIRASLHRQRIADQSPRFGVMHVAIKGDRLGSVLSHLCKF